MGTPLSFLLWATLTPFSTQAQNHMMQLKTGDPHHKQENYHQNQNNQIIKIIIKIKMSSIITKIFIGTRETEEETVLAQHSHRLLVFIPGANSLFHTRFSKTRLPCKAFLQAWQTFIPGKVFIPGKKQ